MPGGWHAACEGHEIVRTLSASELDHALGGFAISDLFTSVTPPDSPFYGINIGTRYRRERLIEKASAECLDEGGPYEPCMVRKGVRGPGF